MITNAITAPRRLRRRPVYQRPVWGVVAGVVLFATFVLAVLP